MATITSIGDYQSRRQRLRARMVANGYCTECPVLGQITAAQCKWHRNREFAATNPTRVRLGQTCPTCSNNPKA